MGLCRPFVVKDTINSIQIFFNRMRLINGLKLLCLIAPFIVLKQTLSEIKFSEKLFADVHAKYGSEAEIRVRDWQQLLEENKGKAPEDQLFEVNNFLNQTPFVDDIEHWGKTDYWATPVEFLASNGGDCEDFTIAKYFSLRSLGIPDSKMRLMYVKALRLNQAHMVLAYFPTPDAVPLVLDNINPRILPANQRRDLLPVYSFNGDGLWLAKAQGRGKQLRSDQKHSLWEDLTARIEHGF